MPQYTTVTLGALTAAAWNGLTGGILALDVAGQLNLGGGTAIVDGKGFRGGAGMQLVGGVGGATNADYRQTSPTTYTGAAGGATGIDGAKGEGVAGTPRWVESAGTFLQTTTTIGYPNGAADGSMARGAPGNAGGGGTDGDAAGNIRTPAAAAAATAGSGGFGSDSWNTNLSDGRRRRDVVPGDDSPPRHGGWRRAGSRNNSDSDNQASGGAAGGGIIFIRADSLTGTATLTANGCRRLQRNRQRRWWWRRRRWKHHHTRSEWRRERPDPAGQRRPRRRCLGLRRLQLGRIAMGREAAEPAAWFLFLALRPAST